MTTYLSQDRLRHKENNTMTHQQSKMYQSKTFLLFGTLLLVAGQASAAVGSADAPAPYRVSSDCMVCHGMTGRDTLYPIVPRLAGQHKSYMEAQLKAYKDHSRADQNGEIYMWPVAQALDSAKITA
ncbi:c-type cytochrome, partial [Acidithiobacillus sp.]|uniref:c-type cytochrome n=1 Tax=Acidithiobacillus sp. TaxID=1872118 RepID=UPI00258B75A6